MSDLLTMQPVLGWADMALCASPAVISAMSVVDIVSDPMTLRCETEGPEEEVSLFEWREGSGGGRLGDTTAG